MEKPLGAGRFGRPTPPKILNTPTRVGAEVGGGQLPPIFLVG